MIDQASVFAERFKGNPQVLQATVLGQGNIPGLDPYTALNALKLIKESQRMEMAGRAQQPTSSPSIVAETLAPTPMQQGLGAMVPGAMGGQGMPPQGMPPQGMPPQAPVMQRSGGLAGMPTPEENYAEGGIIAFKDRGLVPAYAGSSDGAVAYAGTPAVSANPFADNTEGDDEVDTDADAGQGVGNAGLQSIVFGELQKTVNRIRALERREPTKAEKAEMFKGIVRQLEDVGGPDIYGDVNKSLTDRTSAVDKNYRQDQGLALIAAAGNVLKGRSLAEGASNAAPAFAQLMGEANKAKQAENRAIESMKFNVNDAQRKERMGNRRAAMSAMETARKDELDANKFALDKEKAVATAYGTALRATRPGAASAGAGAKPPKLAERLYDDNFANLMETETPQEGESTKAFQARIRAKAGELTARQVKDYGPTKAGSEEAKLAEKTDTELDKQVDKKKIFDRAWQDAKTPEEQGAAEKAIRDRIIANRPPKGQSQGKPSDSGVNKNSTTAPDISTIKGAPAGSTIGKQTAKGWEVLGPSGTLIGYAQK
jgi:hypothetical protein